MEIERPLDLLKKYRGKEVIIRCKEDKIYRGILVCFDIHINLIIDKTKKTDDDEASLGTSFIRGENVCLIFPGKKWNTKTPLNPGHYI